VPQCADEILPGPKLPPRIHGLTFSHPWCAAVTCINPGMIDCGSCSGLVNLLTTIFHECVHQYQSKFSERAARRSTWMFLKENETALCSDLRMMHACGTPFRCYDAMNLAILDEQEGERDATS